MKKINNYLAAGIYMVLAAFAGVICIACFVIVSDGNIWGLVSGCCVASMIVVLITMIQDENKRKES